MTISIFPKLCFLNLASFAFQWCVCYWDMANFNLPVCVCYWDMANFSLPVVCQGKLLSKLALIRLYHIYLPPPHTLLWPTFISLIRSRPFMWQSNINCLPECRSGGNVTQTCHNALWRLLLVAPAGRHYEGLRRDASGINGSS